MVPVNPLVSLAATGPLQSRRQNDLMAQLTCWWHAFRYAPYTRSKALAEQEVLTASKQGGLATVVVRPRFIWGVDDTVLMPAICNPALRSAAVQTMAFSSGSERSRRRKPLPWVAMFLRSGAQPSSWVGPPCTKAGLRACVAELADAF